MYRIILKEAMFPDAYPHAMEMGRVSGRWRLWALSIYWEAVAFNIQLIIIVIKIGCALYTK